MSTGLPHTDQISLPTGGDHDAGKINFDFGKEGGILAQLSLPSQLSMDIATKILGSNDLMLPYTDNGVQPATHEETRV